MKNGVNSYDRALWENKKRKNTYLVLFSFLTFNFFLEYHLLVP